MIQVSDDNEINNYVNVLCFRKFHTQEDCEDYVQDVLLSFLEHPRWSNQEKKSEALKIAKKSNREINGRLKREFPYDDNMVFA